MPAMSRRNAKLPQSAQHGPTAQLSFGHQGEHHRDDPSLFGIYFVVALGVALPILFHISVAVGRNVAHDELPLLNLEAATASGAIGNHGSLELGERTQDVNHEVRQWTSVTRQVLEDDIDAFRLKVALDDRQVRDVTAEPVHIVDQHAVE